MDSTVITERLADWQTHTEQGSKLCHGDIKGLPKMGTEF